VDDSVTTDSTVTKSQSIVSPCLHGNEEFTMGVGELCMESCACPIPLQKADESAAVLPRSASDESADRVMHDCTAPDMCLHNSPVMHTVTVPAERNAEPRVSRLACLLAQQPLAVLTAISVLMCVALLVIGTPQIYVGVEGYDARNSHMARVVDGYSFAERSAREYMAATGGLPKKNIENTKQVC